MTSSSDITAGPCETARPDGEMRVNGQPFDSCSVTHLPAAPNPEPSSFPGITRGFAKLPHPDDFCIDENAGVAYITTQRQNTIDRVSLEPSENSYLRHSVARKPFTAQLIGPTKGAWGRRPGEYCRVEYFQA